MSDYVATTCIRLKVPYEDFHTIVKLIKKEEILGQLNEEYDGDYCLYDVNEKLEEDNIRIIDYNDNWYIDIILQNEYGESEISMYMSLNEIDEKVNNFKSNYPGVIIEEIIILAHAWYNGCEEPYTE